VESTTECHYKIDAPELSRALKKLKRLEHQGCKLNITDDPPRESTV
jgi:hypothetical protein